MKTSLKTALISRSLLALASLSVLALPFASRIGLAQSDSASSVTPELRNPTVRRLIVIQGQITALRGTTVTVHTPAYSPPCKVPACTAIQYPARDIKVETTNATFEGADGRILTPQLSIGEEVVVAGTPVIRSHPPSRPSDLQGLRAIVIERDVESQR